METGALALNGTAGHRENGLKLANHFWRSNLEAAVVARFWDLSVVGFFGIAKKVVTCLSTLCNFVVWPRRVRRPWKP
jgi:hypothetical protein